MSLDITDGELALFDEIGRLSVGDYQNTFGHTLPSSVSYFPLTNSEILEAMKLVIEAKDESLWEQFEKPIPDDCYS